MSAPGAPPAFARAASEVAAQGARGLLRSKTVFGAALVGLFAVGLAIALRSTGQSGVRNFEIYAMVLLASIVSPLVSLLLGTWALGAEREGGTLVFLFVRPIRRSAVLAGRAAAAIFASVSTLLVVAVLCDVALGGDVASLAGVLGALALETAALTCVFVLLGTVLPRALYVGLAYAVLVEGAMGSFVTLQSGATLSQHTRNLLARWSQTDPIDVYRLDQGAATSVTILVGAMLVCLAAAVAWIETREMGSRERVKGE